MSLGGGSSKSTTDVRLNGININQASYGNAIPLLYGQNRIPLMLLWYGNFIATPHTQQQSGGKGGGGGSSNTTFTYSASMIMGLCEGPISGVGQVWKDKQISTLAALGLTLFSGAGGQPVWSYLTTNFPSQAVPYDHTAYAAIPNMQLGSSAALPNHTFETTGFLPFNFGTVNDAEPSAILIDYSTDANHGCNFNALGTIQGAGVTTYQSYCMAMGFLVSPYESTQRPAVDFFKEILKITNSDAFLSAGVLNIVPYADTSVTGNGRTYTPNLTPLFAFTDDDLRPGSGSSGTDPVIVDRRPLAQTYNTVRVEYLNRANAYNLDIAEATDAQDIALNGVRVMATLTFHSITTLAVARQVAQLILQRQLYIRNQFTFSVRADYSLLEPMDLVSITDANLGITNKLVRIIEVDDDQGDNITLIAEDMLVGTASAPLYNWQASQGYAANYAATPPSVATPVIFAAPSLLVTAAGGYEMWIAIDQGAAGSWGGADVYMSLDGTSYIFAGTHNGAARYGTLTANLATHADPDTVDTLSIALTNAATTPLQIVSGSVADYNNLRTLIFVDGEFMAYQTATLTSAGNYNLTQLRRGLYGSLPAAHLSGTNFVRIDAAIFRVPFDVGMMGQTIHFKFCSFNIFGQAHQSLAAATDYTTVLAYNNAGQNMPGALTLIGVGVTTASNTAFKSGPNVAWDASVYSAQSYTNGCSVSCYPVFAATNAFMVGLTTNPTASNSYTNLNYALYVTGTIITIYESGTLIGTFAASYTSATLLNIVYDGKHIGYYIGGVLVRSVPITGLTLFAQLCFNQPNDTAYGIDFGPSGTAVTPYTLVPMSANVACAGTKAMPNSNAATGAWGSRNFQSAESYNNGVQVSFSVTAGTDALALGFSTAPATGDTTGTLHFMAGWYARGGSTRCDILFNGANIGIFGTTPLATDVFTITYDNFTFRWWRNGALIHQEYLPAVGPLFLFGDIFDNSTAFPNEAFVNISFGPYGLATPQQFIARGNCVVADTNVTKQGGVTAWDSDAYSINGYATCHLVWKANDLTGVFMGALATSIPITPGYTALNYAIDCSAGTWVIYESGVSTGVTGSYTTQDYFAITYDASTVTYWKNSVSLRTVSIASLTLFADVVMQLAGSSCNSLEFGPSATIPLLDTPQLGLNAATDVTVVTASTVTMASSGGAGIITTLESVTVGPYAYATNVVLTATFTWNFQANVAVTQAFQGGLNTVTTGFTNAIYCQISPAANTELQNQLTCEQTYALAAGTTTTYYLLGNGGLGSTHWTINTATGITLKAEVIKR